MTTVSITYTFAPATLIESAKANQNFQDLVSYINAQAIVKDASVAFTATPSGPALDPVSDNQFARKKYIDAPFIRATCTTAAYGSPVIDTLVTPNGGGNWTNAHSRGSWTMNPSGFLLPETGSYIAGFTTFLGGLSATPNISSNAQANSVVFAVDMGAWTGSQPTSTLSGAGFFRGTAGQQVLLKVTMESGSSSGAVASLWAVKIPGST